MTTTRRTFLRVLGAAMVGAVVMPAVPIPLPVPVGSSNPWWRAQTLGSGRPLTAAMMREVYERCTCSAGFAPEVFITTREVAESYARMCGLVFDLEIAA